jgi:hypothetical protein
MKLLTVICTSGLFLLLGSTTAYAAQDRPEEAKPEKQEAKPEAKPAPKTEAKPAARSEAKPEAKPGKQEETQKPAEKQQQQKVQQSKSAGAKSGGAHGRISEAHYSASFGSSHHFHVNQGEFNNRRFNYGGYSFGFIDAWPVGWYYTDDVYVVYDGGGYFMYDVVHPGIRISVNIL